MGKPCDISDLRDDLAIGVMRDLRARSAQYYEILPDGLEITFPDRKIARIPECWWCFKQGNCPLQEFKEIQARNWTRQQIRDY